MVDTGNSPEEHGEWLNFRMQHGGVWLPVRISKETLQEHFGATSEPGGLTKAYLSEAAIIHSLAADKVVAGATYTVENPLLLNVADF